MPRFRASFVAICLAASLSVVTPAPSASAVMTNTGDWTASPVGQAPCPEGESRTSSLYSEGYESAIPESRFSSGMNRVQWAYAPEGTAIAQAVLGGSGAAWSFLPYVQATPGTNTRLAFAAHSTGAAGDAIVSVNSVSAALPTGPWRGVSVDVTAATRDEEGWLGTWFQQRGAAGTVLELDNVQVFTCRPNATTRIGGADRYEVAANLAALYPAGVQRVYVASGLVFPDALSGSALAATEGAPLLLVRTDAIPATIEAALTRLAPQEIVILGGPATVSDGVATQLGRFGSVSRIGGSDRYAVSAGASARFAPGRPHAFVATGENYPDALAGGALAGSLESPLLLTRGGALPESVSSELQRLQPARIVILGGPASVSPEVEAALAQYATGPAPKVHRIGGADRYEVSANAAAWFGNPPESFLASGLVFADSLTGGALAGKRGAPLLLTRPLSLPATVQSRLTAMQESRGTALGSWGSVSSLVRDAYGLTLP